MLKAIKRQISVLWTDYLNMLCFVLGAFVFGKVLLELVMRLDQEATEYFALGTVVAAFMAVIYIGIMGLIQMQQCFNIQVSMGSTRKHFFISYYAAGFLLNCIIAIILILLNMAENTMNAVIYQNWEQELDILPYLIRWALPAAVLVSAAGGFCGVMIMKFGKKASVTLWCLWMFSCLGIPQILEAADEAPASVIGKVGGAVMNAAGQVPEGAWIWLCMLMSAVLLAVSWMLLRRQQVTN